MNRIITAALIAIAACLCAGQIRAQTPPPVIPPDWLPALTPSIKSILEELKNADTQAEMNALSKQIFEMRDAQLFIAYVRLYDRLDARARAKLLAEQKEWMAAREKAAAAAVKSKGGSLAPLEANDAAATLTEERLSELRARLKALRGKSKD